MYKKSIPFKDFKDNPRTMEVQFNLTIPEVVKLMKEFKAVFDWQESMGGEPRDLDPTEVVEFYTNFEEILLTAYGKMSDDGLLFKKSGRYEFEESALFAATMVYFVTNPEECMKLIEGIMPKGMADIVKNADENLAQMAKEAGDDDLRAQVARLQAQLEAAKGTPEQPKPEVS